MARGAGYLPTGMGACAAKIQALERQSIRHAASEDWDGEAPTPPRSPRQIASGSEVEGGVTQREDTAL